MSGKKKNKENYTRRKYIRSSSSSFPPIVDELRAPASGNTTSAGENKYENETEWKYTIVFGLGSVVVVGLAGGRTAGDRARRRSIRTLYGIARARVAHYIRNTVDNDSLFGLRFPFRFIYPARTEHLSRPRRMAR